MPTHWPSVGQVSSIFESFNIVHPSNSEFGLIYMYERNNSRTVSHRNGKAEGGSMHPSIPEASESAQASAERLTRDRAELIDRYDACAILVDKRPSSTLLMLYTWPRKVFPDPAICCCRATTCKDKMHLLSPHNERMFTVIWGCILCVLFYSP